MAHLDTLPEIATMADLIRAYPKTAQPAMALAQAVLRGPSELTEQQREFIFAFGSGLNACHYCHGAHTAAAEALGADAGLVAAAVADIEGVAIDARFKALLFSCAS